MITNFADILADVWEQLNHYLKMDLLEFFLMRIWCEKHFAIILIKLLGWIRVPVSTIAKDFCAYGFDAE